MNKNLIFAAAFLFVLFVGGWLFIFMNKTIESGQTTDFQGEELSDLETGKSSRTIRDLMSISNSMTCTYKDTENDSEGTVYVSDGRLRGDFIVNTGGNVTNSHMISVNESVYIWSDDSDQGVMFSTENIDAIDSGENSPNPVEVDMKHEYDCSEWDVDETYFDFPGDVNFVDMSQFIPDNEINSSDQVTEGF